MSSRTHRRKPIPKREGLLSTALPNWPEEIVGRKYVRILQKLANSLRDKRAHGNRRLHLDDVLIAYLLAFFNWPFSTVRCGPAVVR